MLVRIVRGRLARASHVALALVAALLAPATSATDACRGVNGNPDGTPVVMCAGTCDSGTCNPRNGSGTWSGYKICNCNPNENPNGCCQIALKRVTQGQPTMELVLIGDCIACGTPTGECTKIVSTQTGNWTPICQVPPPPPPSGG